MTKINISHDETIDLLSEAFYLIWYPLLPRIDAGEGEQIRNSKEGRILDAIEK